MTPTLHNRRHEAYKPIYSAAIGQRITALSYDAEAGYLVIKLDSGEELWISADWEGYHVLLDTPGLTPQHVCS